MEEKQICVTVMPIYGYITGGKAYVQIEAWEKIENFSFSNEPEGYSAFSLLEYPNEDWFGKVYDRKKALWYIYEIFPKLRNNSEVGEIEDKYGDFSHLVSPNCVDGEFLLKWSGCNKIKFSAFYDGDDFICFKIPIAMR